MTGRKDFLFKGFSHQTLGFLRNLEENNNKLWFEANKQDYTKHLLEPLQNLVSDLGPYMLAIDPYFEVTPAVNKTISRMHRDTRFSKDISPYKITIWITFKRPAKEWQDAPAYFLELCQDYYRYGMGFYSARKDTIDKFREVMDKNPQEFAKAFSHYQKQKIFVIEGEKYKRILDASKPAEILDWYQRKNLYLVCNRTIDERLFSHDLLHDLINGFELLAPLYHYLGKLK